MHVCMMHGCPLMHSPSVLQSWTPISETVEGTYGQRPPEGTFTHFASTCPRSTRMSPQQLRPPPQSSACAQWTVACVQLWPGVQQLVLSPGPHVPPSPDGPFARQHVFERKSQGCVPLHAGAT